MQKEVSIFVPGRISIIGELSDLVADYMKVNSSIIPGEVIASGIDKGIYASVSESKDFIYSYNNQMIEIKKMNEKELDSVSKSSSFFSYVCSVALYMKRNYNVKGIDIKVIYMTLPIKKGLSSSAAASVLVVKAFNIIYNLNINDREIMEIAYKSERYALSMCGRLDQICVKGINVSHIVFYKDDLIIKPVDIHKEMNFVVCSVNGVKNTRNILKSLHSCFPFPKTEVEKNVKKMLCEDNKLIVDRGLQALNNGDLKSFGKVMSDAQKLIDDKARKICKDLEGPKLHQIMNDITIKELSFGSKGVGSNGDGVIEILAKNKLAQNEIIQYLQNNYKLDPFKFDIKKTYKIKKAVILVAGFVKPLLLKLIEDLDDVGIEKILLIVEKNEEKVYSDFFKKKLSNEHFNALTDLEKEYELKIMRMGEKILFKEQKEQLGYGPAVLESRDFASNEPVLMVLGDTIYKTKNEESCIGQVLALYDKVEKPIISLHSVSEDEIYNYGIARGKKKKNIIEIEEIIEKPNIKIAKKLKIGKDYYGIFGISVIDNIIYEALNCSDNKEMEFTKAIDIASKKKDIIGFIVNGKQYDLGNAISYKKSYKRD